ncbi:zinc finger transcriptional activator [Diatrype stigma]|uniref:Zinc finger transcriptional activator n=1 Tax=Diatrype stigma TaxID=117547 RepID=A0AAN9UPJ0_9PEZI
MIERCLWGQEAFGGGFCGSGADESQTSSTAPWRGLRKGSLRTLGTIESLMILTEWHPRALHFPPDEAIDELMLPLREGPSMNDDHLNVRLGGNVGGRRIESWLEPAWRSDRMCWMLLSNAMGLAYELGVFDDIDELLAAQAITRPEYEDEAYRLRANRIKRLLLVYLTQLAGRLGWTNMVPESIRTTDPVFSRKRPLSNEANTPATNISALSTGFSYIPDVELDDQIIQCWVGVSNAMHLGNERLFRSRKHTTDIIQSGKYTALLKEFQPILRGWWREFERFKLPEFIRHILTIEYEYVRIYVNSLALQAVVERCTSQAGGNIDSTQNGAPTLNPLQMSPRAQNYYGNLPLGHLGGFSAEDQEYVKEVVDGSRNLLRTVVDGLLPNGYLKHAPVRTYFRIVSGAMFLLKTFALGAPKSDVQISIELLDRSVFALRNCVVDDIHLGTRFGDLLESLTSRLRDRFKFAQAVPTPAEGKSPHANSDTNKTTSVNGASHSMENGYLHPAGKPKETVAAPGQNDWTSDDQMWYLPPGPSFFQNMGENTNITMTDQGVNMGGVDLLEYMAMDPIPFNNMDGSAPSYQ